MDSLKKSFPEGPFGKRLLLKETPIETLLKISYGAEDSIEVRESL